MALSSNDSPVALYTGCAASNCDPLIQPVIAAQNPKVIYTESLPADVFSEPFLAD